MFDYISIELENRLISELLINPMLCFTTPINEETGELIYENHYYKRKVAKFQNLTFTIHTNLQLNVETLNLTGSIHKFHTDGANYTDFDLNSLKMALNAFKTCFDIDLTTSIIHSLEFGVNITVPFSCKSILDNLLSYRSIKPTEDRFNGKGQMIMFKLSHYTIKVYNKGLQYFNKGILKTNTDDLMRFEIHIDRMDYLFKKRIHLRRLSDLLNSEYHSKLRNLLTKAFNELVIYDSRIDKDLLSSENASFLIEANNPKYWHELRLRSGRKQYSRKLDKFRTIISENTETNIQETISNLIEFKWSDLSNNVPKLQSVENIKMSRNYSYIVCNNGTTEKRFCRVTGIDISHQPLNTFYVSESTLDQMRFINPVQYYRLMFEFMPTIYDDRLNYRIAHNIRNRHTNQFHSLKKKAVNSLVRTTIFNGNEVMTLTPQQLEIILNYTNQY